MACWAMLYCWLDARVWKVWDRGGLLGSMLHCREYIMASGGFRRVFVCKNLFNSLIDGYKCVFQIDTNGYLEMTTCYEIWGKLQGIVVFVHGAGEWGSRLGLVRLWMMELLESGCKKHWFADVTRRSYWECECGFALPFSLRQNTSG